MHGLSISRAWEETKEILGRDGRLFASVSLALIVLPQTVFGAFFPNAAVQRTAAAELVSLVTIIIGLVAQIALNRLAIGPSTTVGSAIGHAARRTPLMIVALFLLGLVLALIFMVIAIPLALLHVFGPIDSTIAPPPSLVAFVIVFFVLAFAIFQLVVPISAAESVGPVRILTRSWQLGRSQYLRLLAFLVVVFTGLIVVWLAGQFLAGIFSSLALGQPDPGSLSALILSLLLSLIQAAFSVVAAVMLARIYVQLAGRGAQASVPSSGT